MSSEAEKVAATVIPRTEDDNEYLVAKREDNGDWEFPGGKKHSEDRDIEEAAEREIKEEIDIEIEAENAAIPYSFYSDGYEIIPVLATHSYRDLDQEISLAEHTDYRWIDPANPSTYNSLKLGKEKKCLEAFDLLWAIK